MTELQYTVVVLPDPDGGFFTDVPSLPGCGSQGETEAEALEMTKEAIQSYIGSLRKHGEPIPSTIATSLPCRSQPSSN